MNSSPATLALFQVTAPGASGWLVLVVWFVVFVLVLNTIIFFLRRLFRRLWRNSSRAGANARRGEKHI